MDEKKSCHYCYTFFGNELANRLKLNLSLFSEWSQCILVVMTTDLRDLPNSNNSPSHCTKCIRGEWGIMVSGGKMATLSLVAISK